MPIPVTVPRLGWNMDVGTFVAWLKVDGDVVRPGDVVFSLEGEKATEEIESFDSGVLHIPTNSPTPGDRIAVGTVIGYLLQPGEAPPSPVVESAPTRLQAIESNEPIVEPVLTRPDTSDKSKSLPVITPRARRLAVRLNMDCSTIRGSGRAGRIRERDVATAANSSPSLTKSIIPLTTIRKAIADRMVQSRHSTAPVTLTAGVNATNLVNLREQFKAVAENGPVPSYSDFFVTLAAVALQKHPILTARWTDNGIVLPDRIDIGIAVDTEAGLLVPVIRDIPALTLRQVMTKSRALFDRARQGELSTRELQGGCFTITNLGAYGIDAFTPMINPPECAVLGVGRIERRPAMEGDRVVGRDMVTLSLTFDHRIVDGGPAARFLQTLAKCVENPGPSIST